MSIEKTGKTARALASAQDEAAESAVGPSAGKSSIHSVATAMRLLKVFIGPEPELGLSEIGRRLKLAKSSVHRLVSILIEEGVLEQNSLNGKYRLGIGLLPLGTQVRRRMPVAREARPFMVQLRAKTDETVVLTILAGANVLYIRNLESPRAIRMRTDIGTEKPALCTAEGMAILAFQPPETIDRLLAAGVPARTAKTVTDPGKLRAILAQVRSDGYVIDDEGSEDGVRGVAAPIRDASGQVIAAIGIAGPLQRLAKGPLQKLVPAVVGAAEATSAALGYRPAMTA